MNIFTQFFKKNPKVSQKKSDAIMTDIMRREAKIGGEVFGPIPKGTTREFFCLNETTWVWYERSASATKTTQYIVRENGVFKSVNNAPYEAVGGEELKNLERAADIYAERVTEKLYARPTTG